MGNKDIVRWLIDSGLKVNEAKTEICLFHQQDTTQVEIDVCDVIVKSKDHMNVVGVMFDRKLTWAKHISIQSKKQMAHSTL